jgi:prepilin-type N-terminal cleavage/methylation domain-containing protein/prepilin-type processing-associated H-X9-DG protein
MVRRISTGALRPGLPRIVLYFQPDQEHCPDMRSSRGQIATGFTLIELLVVIGVIAILALLLLPVLAKFKPRVQRIVCTGHLKEIGHAFHLFAQDHGTFPMRVPVAQGGSLEANQPQLGSFPLVPRNFSVLSNQLSNPKILVCPSDERASAGNFARLTATNISYRAGVNATMSEPGSVLSLDRNVALPEGWKFSPTQDKLTLRWTDEMHQRRGNLLFADNHVEQSDSGPVMSLRGHPSATRAYAQSSSSADARPGTQFRDRTAGGPSNDSPQRDSPSQSAGKLEPPLSPPSRPEQFHSLADFLPFPATARAEGQERSNSIPEHGATASFQLATDNSDDVVENAVPFAEGKSFSQPELATTGSGMEIAGFVDPDAELEQAPVRWFGMLAQAGYAVSLLLLLVALLALYLRAQIRKRQSSR